MALWNNSNRPSSVWWLCWYFRYSNMAFSPNIPIVWTIIENNSRSNVLYPLLNERLIFSLCLIPLEFKILSELISGFGHCIDFHSLAQLEGSFSFYFEVFSSLCLQQRHGQLQSAKALPPSRNQSICEDDLKAQLGAGKRISHGQPLAPDTGTNSSNG